MGELLRRPIMHPLDYKLIIFDADGTLSRCTVEGQPCPNKAGEWELMPNVKEVCGFYRWSISQPTLQPYECFWGVSSNQGGVGLGIFEYDVAYQLLIDRAVAAGLPLEITLGKKHIQISMCPHRPASKCICRKPSAWQIYEIALSHGIYHARDILYVGDMESDLGAARAATVDFCWSWDFFGWEPPSMIKKG